jgi:hypothetical protein
VLVYAIHSQRSIVERVIPFFERSVIPSSCKRVTFERFREIVEMIDRKEHLIAEGLIRIVENAYAMNPDSKGRQRLRTLEEVCERILRGHTPNIPPTAGWRYGPVLMATWEPLPKVDSLPPASATARCASGYMLGSLWILRYRITLVTMRQVQVISREGQAMNKLSGTLRDHTPDIRETGWWYGPDCMATCRDDVLASSAQQNNVE